jgi:hypothetical protein
MKTYRHTQPATAIICGGGLIASVLTFKAIVSHQMWFSVVYLLVLMWIFRSLTIEISDTELRWHFGSGWPRRRVPLSAIVSAKPIRTSVMNGWGIHYTRRGRLYNVSGFGAVAIRLRSGRIFCLGTDEPEKLAWHLTGQNSRKGTNKSILTAEPPSSDFGATKQRQRSGETIL